MSDDQNTTHDLIDNTGSTITGGYYFYNGFGAAATGDTSLTRYLYTGRELDPATDLQYNDARPHEQITEGT
jgi:hypothetical protein